MASEFSKSGRPSFSVSISALLLLSLACGDAIPKLEALKTCSEIDSRALKQFQSEIVFGGEEIFQSWRQSTDCCHGWTGVHCNEAGRVTTLTIASSRDITTKGHRLGVVTGSSLGNLTYLEELTMVNIDWSGRSIPPSWGMSLRNLRVFRVEKCNVGGLIPAELCRLSSLQSLVLKSNRLEGDVPNCFFSLSSRSSLSDHHDAWMRNLTVLDLGNNQLRGRVPSIPCQPAATCKFIDR